MPNPDVITTRVEIVGGGPAGLMLSHLLSRSGINNVVVEKRDHETIRNTHRAGILEHGSVSMLVDSGVSDRVLTAGYKHEGIDLRFGGESHRIDFQNLVGEAVWLYPQNEVFVDLAAARERDGGEVHFSAVADRAGRGGDAGAGGTQGEQVAQVLLGDPDRGDLLAVGVGVEHADDGGQVLGVQVLDVVAEHVVQRAGQAEFLVRVLGAVTQPPERVVYLPVSEFHKVKGIRYQGHPGGGAGAVGGGQVHRQVPQFCCVPGEQVVLRGGGTALGQAQGAPGAEIDQVGEPFGACAGDLAGLGVDAVGGGAAAELIHPGGLDRLLLLVQVSELLIGVGGESAGGGAVRDAVAAGRGRGRHQVIADGLAEPGPQPGGQPGPVLDGGQPLGESPLLAARCAAAPPGLGPVQQDLPVAGEHVAGRGPGMLLDPGGRLAAPRAAARGLRGGVGDHLHQGLPVPGHGHRGDQQPGDPQQDRRRGAARRAGRRGLRGPGGAGNVHRWRFLFGNSLSWSKRESRGNRFLSASYCNSQANPWICGKAARNSTPRSARERETRLETGQRICLGEAKAADEGNGRGNGDAANWPAIPGRAARQASNEPRRSRSQTETPFPQQVLDQTTDAPKIRFNDFEGNAKEIHAEILVGADGAAGICKWSIPQQHRTDNFVEYPFAWFGILCEAPPSAEELIYCNSSRGFALISQREDHIQRMYFQCPSDEDVDGWTEEMIWDELQARVDGPDRCKYSEVG